jgi:putative transposase
MDVKGRAMDKAWIERFWKTLKYDYVYLNLAEDGFELFEGVQNQIDYCHVKIHHATGQIPNNRYYGFIQKAA